MKCTIIDMSNKVLEHIAARYDSVKEGVKAVMGGKVLDYEAKTIKREGLKEGIEQGIEQGEDKLSRLITILMEGNRSHHDGGHRMWSGPHKISSTEINFMKNFLLTIIKTTALTKFQKT